MIWSTLNSRVVGQCNMFLMGKWMTPANKGWHFFYYYQSQFWTSDTSVQYIFLFLFLLLFHCHHFLIFHGLQEAILMLYLYYDISSWWEIYLTFPRVWSRYYKDIICQSWTWLTATPCRWHYFCVREGIYLILNSST